MVRRLVVGSLVAAVAVIGATWGQLAFAAEGGDVVDIDYVVGDGVDGVYVTHSDGEIEARDDLPHFGDRPALDAGEVVVGLSVLPDVDGYWLFTDKGRVVPFGAADFLGDVSAIELAAPVISAIATPDGLGYYMVAGDGGIFAFGTAEFFGSVPEVLPGVTLDSPVVGIVPSTTGQGYLLVAGDGGIFAFGDAVFYGSIPGILPGVTLDAPVVAVVAEATGYLMVGSDGGAFTFGSTTFHGSLGGRGKTGIVAITVLPGSIGYVMVDTVGTLAQFGGPDGIGTTNISPTTLATDLALVQDLWSGHAASWAGGAEGFLAELRANSYPDYDLSACELVYGGEFVENYVERFTIDEATFTASPDSLPQTGDLAGLRPAGRIYTMTGDYASGVDPDFTVVEQTLQVTIFDGAAYYLPDCDFFENLTSVSAFRIGARP